MASLFRRPSPTDCRRLRLAWLALLITALIIEEASKRKEGREGERNEAIKLNCFLLIGEIRESLFADVRIKWVDLSTEQECRS